ncbi:MAG: hypothetical protein AB1402_09835 [Bacillota bacterium]
MGDMAWRPSIKASGVYYRLGPPVGYYCHLPVLFVDEDQSLHSRRVLQSFADDPDYRVLYGNRVEAVEKVRGFEVQAAFVLREHFGRRIEQGLAPQVDVYQVHESGELIATRQVFRAAVAKVAANSGIAELALTEISRDKAVAGREDAIRERAYQKALESWFPGGAGEPAV